MKLTDRRLSMIRQNGFTSRDFIISESLKEHKEQITLLDNSDLTLLCHVYFNNHCHNIHTNLWVSMKPKHIDTNTIFFFYLQCTVQCDQYVQ